MNELNKYFKILSDLSSVNRYSQSFLIKKENVLEHTGFVTSLAYLISLNVEGVNVGKLLSRAVVHDIDEIITGDLPNPVKYYNEKTHEVINKLECQNMLKICNFIGDEITDKTYESWRYAKDKTMIGFIIKICDMCAVLFKINQEFYTFGNRTLLGHSVKIKNRIDVLKQSTHYKNEFLSKFIDSMGELQIKLEKEIKNEDSNY